MENPTLPTLGMRHLALNVRDAQASKKFYMDVLQMQIEWEPDTKSVYLTSAGLDNLALHQSDAPLNRATALNHLGFFVPKLDDVDRWYAHVQNCVESHGAKIVKEIKTHRDGARSFYFEDRDGNLIQLLFYPNLKATP